MGDDGTIGNFGAGGGVALDPGGAPATVPTGKAQRRGEACVVKPTALPDDTFVAQDNPTGPRERPRVTSPERALSGGGPVVSGPRGGPHERSVSSQGFSSWAGLIAHHNEGRTPPPEFIARVARANNLDPSAPLPAQVLLPNREAIFAELHPTMGLDMSWLAGAQFVVTSPGQTWTDHAREVLGANASDAEIAVGAEVLARHNEALAPPVVVARPERNDLLRQMRARGAALHNESWLEMARRELAPGASHVEVWREAQRLAEAQGQKLVSPWGDGEPAIDAAASGPVDASAGADSRIARLGGNLRNPADVPTAGRAYKVQSGDTLHSIVLRAFGAELSAYAETVRAQLQSAGWTPEQIEAHVQTQLARKVENYEMVFIDLYRFGAGGSPIDPAPGEVMFLVPSMRLHMVVAAGERNGELAKRRDESNRIYAHVRAANTSVLSDLKALALAPAPAMTTGERIEALDNAANALQAQGARDAFVATPNIVSWLCSPVGFLAYLNDLYGDTATGRYSSESFPEFIERKNPDMTPSQFALEARRAEKVANMLAPFLTALTAASAGAPKNGFVTIDVRAEDGASAGRAFLRLLKEHHIGVQPELARLIRHALDRAYGSPQAGEMRIDVQGAVYRAWRRSDPSDQSWVGPIFATYAIDKDLEPLDLTERPDFFDQRVELILDVVIFEHHTLDPNAIEQDLRAELLSELRRWVESETTTEKDVKNFEARIRTQARELVRQELTGGRAAVPSSQLTA